MQESSFQRNLLLFLVGCSEDEKESDTKVFTSTSDVFRADTGVESSVCENQFDKFSCKFRHPCPTKGTGYS